MHEALTLAPTNDPRRLRAPDGTILTPPADWLLLPPGDAGLTRRVKAAGPSWTVIEMRGRKRFSRGVWAPAANVEAARKELEAERAEPAYARRREADARRRDTAQASYVEEFAAEVLAFLDFAPTFAQQARQTAAAVAAHATPVGSGTVARTKRIGVERRAEAAVIAWMRHQTTAYDNLKIARVKGRRREVRRELAQVSRLLLDAHRIDRQHPRRSGLSSLSKAAVTQSSRELEGEQGTLRRSVAATLLRSSLAGTMLNGSALLRRAATNDSTENRASAVQIRPKLMRCSSKNGSSNQTTASRQLMLGEMYCKKPRIVSVSPSTCQRRRSRSSGTAVTTPLNGQQAR